MKSDLFDYSPSSHNLAQRLRPTTLEQFVGQEHLLDQGKALYTLIKKDKLPSLIFFGPPGTGKTSLAQLISKLTKALFQEINATQASVKDVREICQKAQESQKFYKQKTILFIDEVHRFNKAQQDVLLPFVEKGNIIFIGATTFNPFFYITPALNSRTLIFEFKKLSAKNLTQLLEKALLNTKVKLEPLAKEFLINQSHGDARVLLNRLEILLSIKEEGVVSQKEISEIFNLHAFSYNRADDHYDIISAFIKSVRGSDPNAALYYLALMLEGGEDIRFIARRLAILAAEDIGLAEPGALAVMAGGYDLIEKIGMPEARIILAEMTLYLCGLPKSNSAYLAIDKALNYVKNNPLLPVPNYLKDSHAVGKKTDKSQEYLYPHDFPLHFVKQNYLQSPLNFYTAGNLGREKLIKNYLEQLWDNQKNNQD